MKKIELTQNKVALVDDADFDFINSHKWSAVANKMGGYYAQSFDYNDDNKQISLLMHRLVLNAPKGVQVDHIDHNGLDNQRSNLRFCTNAENGWNRLPKTGKYKGIKKEIRFYKGKIYVSYSARITTNGIPKYLGCYKTPELAASVYNEAAIKYHKEFAYLNQILI